MFHFTIETEKSVNEAIESVEAALKDEKFGVLWTFNIKDKLEEKGLEFNKDFVVLEVCNPAEAKRVLTENSLAGYFLPCKVVVYSEEGKTKIGMPKPTSLISMLSDEKLTSFAKDIEDRLTVCLKKAAK